MNFEMESTSTIYEELRILFAHDPHLVAIINTAKKPLPEGLAKFLCETGRKRLPELSDCIKGSFWFTFWLFDLWGLAFSNNPKRKEGAASWLRKHREAAIKNGEQYPPELI